MALKKTLQEKAVEATKQKEEKRKKPKPEEHEGLPQRRHCPPNGIRTNISMVKSLRRSALRVLQDNHRQFCKLFLLW
jgi:hypothetical protein